MNHSGCTHVRSRFFGAVGVLSSVVFAIGCASQTQRQAVSSQSIAAASNAQQVGPTYATLLQDARRQLRSGETDKAAASCLRAQSLDPSRYEAYAILADAYLHQGKLNESKSLLLDAIKRAPESKRNALGQILATVQQSTLSGTNIATQPVVPLGAASGAERVTMAELQSIGQQVKHDTDPAARKSHLETLFAKSGTAVRANVSNVKAWEIRAAAATELKLPYYAAEAAQVLRELGALDRAPQPIVNLVAKIELNGWMGSSFEKQQQELTTLLASVREGHNEYLRKVGGFHAREGDPVQAMEWYRKGAAAGDSQAMEAVGRCYYTGAGAPLDMVTAMEWWSKAVDAGDGMLALQLGAGYLNGVGEFKKDYAEAMRWFQKGAKLNKPQAMDAIGGLYEGGFGVAKDYAEAMRWYQNAADAGDSGAMYSISRMYKLGLGVNRDSTKALGWLRRSSDAGNYVAMFTLATMYLDGEGVEKDEGEGMRWLTKSADLGDVQAMIVLGDRYRVGQAVPHNDVDAFRWYQKAAASSEEPYNHWAATRVGWCYQNGLGISRDYGSALSWYRKSANAGDATGMNNLGFLYECGLGVSIDYNTARSWYEKAIQAGNVSAMVNLGHLFQYELRDFDNALKWYYWAADRGDATAMTNIGFLYENGLGMATNYYVAMDWYRKGAKAGDPTAMVNVGLLYEKGYGVSRDIHEAARWMWQASTAGNSVAKKWLDEHPDSK